MVVVEKLEDILTRLGNKIANDAEQNKAGQGGQPRLARSRFRSTDRVAERHCA